jgi:predicted PurR-regulated permease PerM
MPIVEGNQQVNIKPESSRERSHKVLTGVIAVLVVLVVIGSILVAIYTLNSTDTKEQPTTVIRTKDNIIVNDVDDLKKLEKEINSVDLNELTKDLDKNDKDAAGF